MKNIIEVRNLSKVYKIDHYIKTNNSLADTLGMGSKQLMRKIFHGFSHQEDSKEDFWALKDVSFELQAGERLAIIGGNGAGKSTLLKILSRITTPTAGTARIRGRLTSLLEVGTGFHPDLTGKENIFLNGAILGMPSKNIRGKFDQIVDFSGVEKFIDTPVKYYSSGMYVRLAFAIAVNLDPEIIILDEVLAVGDAAFQEKCMTKMNELVQHGATLIFVSHGEQAIKSLCTKALYLKNGRIEAFGEINSVYSRYSRDLYFSI